MAVILNSDNLNFTILDSAILVFPLKLTHTCQDWFPSFAQKKIHSFILTQLDEGSHLEFWHLGFNHFAQNLTDSWQLNLNGCHLEFCHVGFSHFAQNSDWNSFNHSSWWWQPSWMTAILDSAILHKINFTHSIWLNLMMAAILNSAMLDSATAILDSDTLLSSLRFT